MSSDVVGSHPDSTVSLMPSSDPELAAMIEELGENPSPVQFVKVIEHWETQRALKAIRRTRTKSQFKFND